MWKAMKPAQHDVASQKRLLNSQHFPSLAFLSSRLLRSPTERKATKPCQGRPCVSSRRETSFECCAQPVARLATNSHLSLSLRLVSPFSDRSLSCSTHCVTEPICLALAPGVDGAKCLSAGFANV